MRNGLYTVKCPMNLLPLSLHLGISFLSYANDNDANNREHTHEHKNNGEAAGDILDPVVEKAAESRRGTAYNGKLGGEGTIYGMATVPVAPTAHPSSVISPRTRAGVGNW